MLVVDLESERSGSSGDFDDQGVKVEVAGGRTVLRARELVEDRIAAVHRRCSADPGLEIAFNGPNSYLNDRVEIVV